MHLNGELLGTLSGKRQDAALVYMDNKHFITLVSMHIMIIALVGCISLVPTARKNMPRPLVQYNSQYCMLTRVIRYIYMLMNVIIM